MHQPNFLPWIGFFHKMAHADVFVLLDRVQVPLGRSPASRTQIKAPDGARWLTMPVHGKGKPYDEATVADNKRVPKLWRTIDQCYGKARYFNDYADIIHDCIVNAPRFNLALINSSMIDWAAKEVLRLDTRIVRQSATGVMDNRLTLAPSLSRMLGCNTYLSGRGAEAYNDPQAFSVHGVWLEYQEFICPEYPQPWGPFIPNLSIIDLLFNCGDDAREILR